MTFSLLLLDDNVDNCDVARMNIEMISLFWQL